MPRSVIGVRVGRNRDHGGMETSPFFYGNLRIDRLIAAKKSLYTYGMPNM